MGTERFQHQIGHPVTQIPEPRHIQPLPPSRPDETTSPEATLQGAQTALKLLTLLPIIATLQFTARKYEDTSAGKPGTGYQEYDDPDDEGRGRGPTGKQQNTLKTMRNEEQNTNTTKRRRKS